jgi:conjugal transfer pilus assembly protein TraB
MSAFDTPRIKNALTRLSPKQRQYAALVLIMAIGVGALWAVLAVPGSSTKNAGSQHTSVSGETSAPTNIDMMAPGQQVNPVDQWVGTAGRKLAQYEHERDEQSRINHDRKEFEDKTMQRFGELEQRLTAAAASKTTPAQAVPAVPEPINPIPNPYPPANALPANLPVPNGRTNSGEAMPPGTPGEHNDAMTPGLVHVSMGKAGKPSPSQTAATTSEHAGTGTRDTIETYLPVSFTRGTLLGGLDAPTGGQSQSNPHPVLIRLADNSILPNRFRAEYQECLVVAAGYGDISSERAYLRTESLSCVRDDGSTLDVKIQGSIYGEDGKVGMRGRLVSKQGQILANALLAGVVSGIGQGLSTSATTTSTSALGTIASLSGSDAYRAGLGTGVGHALDRLAQYYIKLAEQTFPVIEIDAGREIDVVITKGVRINAPVTTKNRSISNLASLRPSPEDRYGKESSDEDY